MCIFALVKTSSNRMWKVHVCKCSKRVVMNDFFKLPVALTEALSKNDMMLVVGGDRAVKITVVNEGHGCNMVGALNRGTGCGC